MKINYKSDSVNIKSDKSYDNINSWNLEKRCKDYQENEPHTIQWVSSFDNNSIFYDIGSNIGGYSFIAYMANKNLKVYSFEPNFMNFYTQLKTCKENNISNIFPINIAINNSNKFNYFNYSILGNGGDGSFGDELKNQMINSDYMNPFSPHNKISLEIGVLGLSLDSLVYDFGLDVPNYLKIDVDGNELLVLKGAQKLLNEEKVKEIFIEIDDKIYVNSEIENFLKQFSFDIYKDINVGSIEKPIRMVLFKK